MGLPVEELPLLNYFKSGKKLGLFISSTSLNAKKTPE